MLDSSFNPPSRAHAWIAQNAVLSDSGGGGGKSEPETRWEGKRLLLLLATQNADKAAKPAGFEDRLVMMVLMAKDIFSRLLEAEESMLKESKSAGAGDERKASLGMFAVDVGVTKDPFFADKASAIDESEAYGEKERFEQVHLTGFDTLTRIFDKKYYGEQGLSVLQDFLTRGRIRAALRPGGSWGEMEEQREWVETARRGEKEADGFRREWAERIVLVESEDEVLEGVSSTKVREGAQKGDRELIDDLVGREVMDWIKERRLYLDEDNDVKG